MCTPLTVLIPTHCPPTLLKQALESIARCKLPDSYRELVVIENGSRAGAEALVETLPERLNARYMHRERGNKSNALNEALVTIDEGLVVFFDDDVEIHPDTLVAYQKAASRRAGDRRCFFGGPFKVIRGAPPPEWIEALLPRSARGWNPDAGSGTYGQLFLGFNWAAYRSSLTAMGGFNTNYGPGDTTDSVGDESEMQKRLLASGLRKVYVSDAIVTHNISSTRHGVRWLLERKYREGIEVGLGVEVGSLTLGGGPGWLYRGVNGLLKSIYYLAKGEYEASLASMLSIARHTGIIVGYYKIGASDDVA